MITYRKPGPIPRLKRKLTARRFLFFSTETINTYQYHYTKRMDFRLGHAIYVELSKSFEVEEWIEYAIPTGEEFISLLESWTLPNNPLYAIAPDASRHIQTLDLPYRLSNEASNLGLPILSWSVFMWQVRFGISRVHFLSLMNLFPGSLDQLGDDLHTPRLALNELKATEAEYKAHCQRDVQISANATIKYVQWLVANDLGYFCETVPWQAMTAYRTRFMTEEICINVDYAVLEMERKAYHGARTEAFRVGLCPPQEYFLLDVNSMYAHVMADREYPVDFIRMEIKPSLNRLAHLLDEFYVIAEVEIDTNEAAYPYPTASKLVFPVGTFRARLHQSELEFAAQRGHIKSVLRAATYQSAELFRSYVDFFGSEKRRAHQDNDRIGERLAKLYLNSLYGKFGQQQVITNYQGKSSYPGVRHWTCKVIGEKTTFEEWDFYGKHFSVVKSGEKPYSCPSIAGAITAYGRMYLYELVSTAGKDNVFYCDTDSLIVNADGLDRLAGYMDQSLLGRLKMVSASRSLNIYAPKDYQFGPTITRKGVSTLESFANKDAVTSKQYRSMKRALQQHDADHVEVKTVTKHRRGSYDKGVVLSDGHTRPFKLPEESDLLPG